jgi:hypothetical protein
VPPLIDLLGHMGRYYIELNIAHSPVLQRNWGFHWSLLPDLGVDLLIIPLSWLFGFERGVWVITMLLPPLMIWGIARISIALHGRISPFALAAAPFALAQTFQFGFVNYWLASALALHAFASWAKADARDWPALRRAATFGPVALIIWIAHVYGWAIFLVLVGSYELSRRWTGDARRWPKMSAEITLRMWSVALPALLMVAWRSTGTGAVTMGFFEFFGKLYDFVTVLRDQNPVLDIASLLFAIGLIYAGIRESTVRIHPALGVATGLFVLLDVILPRQLFGSAFADSRLWPIAFITMLTAACPRDRSWRPGRFVAGLSAALFTIRVAVTADGFVGYDRDAARHLRALAEIPVGASIATLTPAPCPMKWSDWRQPRFYHLDSLAIVRRQAFVNSQWEVPGGQLLQPLRARGTAFNSDPSQIVFPSPTCSTSFGPVLAEKIQAIPRNRFGYVWLIGFDVGQLPAYPGLSRVYADDRSSMYRLTQPSAQ